MATRVAVVGCGAIGGYTGGRMAAAGEDVTLVEMWPEHVARIRTSGLRLSGLTEAESATVHVKSMHVGDVQSLSKEPPLDVVFISVKSYDTSWVTALIKPYLAPDGFVISLQNCINEERIAEIVGWGRVLGCAISQIGVELVAPGHVKRTVEAGGDKHTVFRAGEVHGQITPRLEEVVRLLGRCDSAKASNNLWGERWSKLVTNSMGTGLSAVSGLGGSKRDLNETTRRVRIRLGSEAVRVGQALGYTLERVQRIDAEVLARAGEGDEDAVKAVTERLIEDSKKRSDENRPSMAQDISKGRRTETDYINGYVAAKGEEIGVPAPTHAKMNELVKRVERGELKPGVENLQGL